MPPVSCIEDHPTGQTIELAGRYINLSQMSRVQNVDRSYLSRILNGKRDPGRMSVDMALRFSASLGMSLDEFLDAIYARTQKLARQRAQIRVWHDYRIARENQEDVAAIRAGRVPAPRVPLA